MNAKWITLIVCSSVLIASAIPANAAERETNTPFERGLLEEEANHQLEAAIHNYQEALGYLVTNRQMLATAVFRLGECYRKLGKLDEARMQYRRILRDFSEQAELCRLSQQVVGDSPDKDEDREHLERIYKAICAYYRDHQDLPNWLSDLVPQYLPDASDLISPVETRTGKSVLYGRQDPKLPTSYIYEFNAGPAAEEFNRGRAVPLTCKEWKLMQLKKFGLVTPILRCHLHNPVLNVAYSGDIYETGLLWENDRRTAALIKSDPRLGPQSSEPSGPRVSVKVVDAKTSEPIPTASVRTTLGSEFGILAPAHGTADTNGVVAVALGDWKINFLIGTATHARYEMTQFEWNREKTNEETIPAEVTIKMTAKGEANK